MAERKDNYRGKHRKLNTGEYQGKDGRYVYYYKDATGKQCKVYSWILMDTDVPPKGKKAGKSLRTLESEIQDLLSKGIDVRKSEKLTLNQAFETNITLRDIRETTKTNYIYMYNKFIKPVFGSRILSTITNSEIKTFYTQLETKSGLKKSTIQTLQTILYPIFEQAIADDIMIKNPCKLALKGTKKEWSTKDSFTRSQQDRFMAFVKERKEQYQSWVNMLIVFLYTGFRVGELVGLTWRDIDFKHNKITINHQVHYGLCEDGKCRKSILPPKTKNSNRTITIADKEVMDAIIDEKRRQMESGIFCSDTIDGYILDADGITKIPVSMTNFIFLNRFGNVQLPHNTNKAFERIRKDYNEWETEQAKKEHREPIIMPHFSNHTLRHTSVTRDCEAGMNPAVNAYRKGHDITTMMTIYNHLQSDFEEEETRRIQNKSKIG